MDQALINALKRQKELRKELAEIEEFLRLYQQFSGADQEHTPPVNTGDGPTHGGAREPTQRGPREPTQGPVRSGPKAVADVAAGILKDLGVPLTRGELATELELRKVSLPGKDRENRARYVGTILWRNPERFEQIKGRGYWLKDTPIPETEEEKRQMRLEGKLL